MPCDTRLKPRQTISQRKAEVKKVLDLASQGLTTGKIKAKIGPQGSIAFEGLAEPLRDGVTDACVYRLIMSSGSATARLAIARAEALAGRPVNRAAVAAGVHSHDGGHTWHSGHAR